jgi:hypothetical protein
MFLCFARSVWEGIEGQQNWRQGLLPKFSFWPLSERWSVENTVAEFWGQAFLLCVG